MSVIADFALEPEKLRRQGLMIYVLVEPASGSVEPKQVRAILDTGAEVSGISLGTTEAMDGAAKTKRKIWTPTHGLREEDALHCRLTFNGGESRTVELSIIRELEPYDVLIGRDLMSEMKLEADFKTGKFTLSWSAGEPLRLPT